MFGLAEIQRMNTKPIEPDPPMTVGNLKRLLEPLSDGVFLAVECENRCEPHPITSTMGPYARTRRRRGDETGDKAFYLVFWQDDNVDLSSGYEDEDD